MADRLTGVFTALATPFTDADEVDEAALAGLVRRQLGAGVAGIVAGATTGESATLTPEEHALVVRVVAREATAHGRATVLAGVSAASTRDACALAERLAAAGADAILAATPPYNKPPQRGLVHHFRAVAAACSLPVVLYNIPGRTGVNLDADTVLELAEDPRFAGIKEASGRLDQVSEILRRRPHRFAVLSGEDVLTLPILALGGDGVVAVFSNQVPGLAVRLVEWGLAGERERAAGLHAHLLPLMRANFIETNPIPVKWCLHALGLAGGHVRPPLGPLAVEHQPALARVLEAAMALERAGRSSTSGPSRGERTAGTPA